MLTPLTISINILEAIALMIFISKNLSHIKLKEILLVIFLTINLTLYDYFHYSLLIEKILCLIILTIYQYLSYQQFQKNLFFLSLYANVLVSICDTFAFMIHEFLPSVSYNLLIPTSKIILISLCILLKRKINIIYNQYLKSNIYLNISIFLFSLIFIYTLYMFGYQIYNRLYMGICVILLTLLAGCLFFVYHYDYQQQIEKQELLLLKQSSQFYEYNNKHIQTSLDDISKMKHDMKYILLEIQNQIKNQHYQEVNDFINSQLNYIEKFSIIEHSGDEILDYLLSYFIPIIKDRHIQFQTYYNQDKIPMKSIDISIILGNLLMNAIEHCDKDKKIIMLQRGKEEEYYYIKIKNSIDHSILNENPQLKSTKQENHHGYGIDNIKRILKSYHGYFIVDEDNYFFYITILLPID